MILLNVLMACVCAGILFTLRWMTGLFRALELMVYYMVIVVAIEQIHSAIMDNFNLIRFSDSISEFFFFKMNQLILFPVATLWLLFSLFHTRLRFMYKLLFLAVWFAGLTFMYVLFERVGVFELTGWNFGYSVVIWYVVLTESLCFSLIFRTMLKRSNDHDPVSS